MPKSQPAPLMSVQQVAEYLAVDVKTVRRLISTGDLPAYRSRDGRTRRPSAKGKLIRVKPADVEALLRRGVDAEIVPVSGWSS
jgi:excisionase family DNA binding protein